MKQPEMITKHPFWAPPMGRICESVLSNGKASTASNWFEHATDLNVYLSKSFLLRGMVNDIFIEISEPPKPFLVSNLLNF